MKLSFLGATRTVTGSAFLLEAGGKRLLVDFGMFQGRDADTEQQLPCAAGEIDFVVATHAHIDHTGHLPLLVRQGFSGPIYATRATAELAAILMADSAHIQKMDTEWENKKRERQNLPPVEPLYNAQDAAAAAALFRPLDYGAKLRLCDNFTIRFTDAGHILGSAMVEVWATEGETTKTVVFSGDVGNLDQPILKDPQFVRQADYLLIESTYGNRIHPVAGDVRDQLARVVRSTFAKGGKVVIPAFAVGRTQELLYYLRELYAEGAFAGYERCPVFLDSPLAIEATTIFNKFESGYYYDKEAMEVLQQGQEILNFPQLQLSISSDDSKSINGYKGSCIIISASGMCDAGRVRHHLKYNLWSDKNAVVLVGYQAEGTLGRRLLEGEKEVRILGSEIAVNATVENIDGLSAHADRNGLLRWLGGFREKPKAVFVVHGEPAAAESFAAYLTETKGQPAFVPARGESVDLLAEEIGLAPAPALEETAEVTLAQQRTPKKRPHTNSALEQVISLLQGISASGQKLPKRELNELVRAADRLWGRMQD